MNSWTVYRIPHSHNCTSKFTFVLLLRGIYYIHILSLFWNEEKCLGYIFFFSNNLHFTASTPETRNMQIDFGQILYSNSLGRNKTFFPPKSYILFVNRRLQKIHTLKVKKIWFLNYIFPSSQILEGVMDFPGNKYTWSTMK